MGLTLKSLWFKRLGIAAFIVGILWYAVFEWAIFIYTPGNDGEGNVYYSPNCAYYLTAHQTPWQKLMRSSWPYIDVVVHLYKKNGELIYIRKANFSEGPGWSGRSLYFVGGDDWVYELPSSAGDRIHQKNCLAQKK